MNKILGVLAASTCFSPLMAMAETEVHFWHAFTGGLESWWPHRWTTLMRVKVSIKLFRPTKEITLRL